MSLQDLRLGAQFYLTGLQPCPYLPGREERKLFTNLRGPDAARMAHELSQRGFRRSQTVAYRPSCPGCAACLSIRIPVEDFRPSRNQKRVLKRNADLHRDICAAWATAEQHDLFRRYLAARHAEGGMGEMTTADFAAMVEDSPVPSRVVEYRRGGPNGRLVGACLSDIGPDGPSMVYSFFDPDEASRSLGGYMILDHVALAEDAGMPFVYLGFWVPGSAKMDYKARFRPFETYIGGVWRRVPDPSDLTHPRDWPVAPL